MTTKLIKNVRLFDPGSGVDEENRSILIKDNQISSLDADRDHVADVVIDGQGLLCVPGFVDMRVHFCQPGGSRRETIATGCAAAAKGGFTTACLMPTTEPTLDKVEIVEFVLAQARAAGTTRVLPVGSVSVGRKGERLSEIAKLTAAGCVSLFLTVIM